MGDNDRPAGVGAAKPDNDYCFWLDLRAQLLGIVALVERRKLGYNVTTAEKCRDWEKQNVGRFE